MNKHSLHTKLFYTAALIMGCFFVLSCENSKKDIKDWTDRVVMKEEVLKVESFMSQDGKRKAKLTAPLMERVMSDTIYVDFPKTLHVDFYDSSNAVETTLDSKTARYFENLGKVFLKDSVVVITVKGDTLKTPELWWDQNTKLFYTDKYTEYRTKTNIYYGRKGMQATQDLGSVIFNDGGGTVQVSESGFPDK